MMLWGFMVGRGMEVLRCEWDGIEIQKSSIISMEGVGNLGVLCEG
jgi:hypothetical protein